MSVAKDDIRAQAQQFFQTLRQILQEADGDIQDLLEIEGVAAIRSQSGQTAR